MCRNKNMNKAAAINSIILRHGKADAQCFMQLQQSLSHKEMLNVQTMLGEDFDEKIHSWADALSEEKERSVTRIEQTEEEIQVVFDIDDDCSSLKILNQSFFDVNAIESLALEINDEDDDVPGSDIESDDAIIIPAKNEKKLIDTSNENPPCPQTRPAKFMTIGDNVDVKCKRRHMTKERNNVDWHLFNSIGVKNRVEIPEELLSTKAPSIKQKSDIDTKLFIPTEQDDMSLRNDFKMLVSRDLVRYIHDLSWMKKHLPMQILHKHIEEMKKESEIVSYSI